MMKPISDALQPPPNPPWSDVVTSQSGMIACRVEMEWPMLRRVCFVLVPPRRPFPIAPRNGVLDGMLKCVFDSVFHGVS